MWLRVVARLFKEANKQNESIVTKFTLLALSVPLTGDERCHIAIDDVGGRVILDRHDRRVVLGRWWWQIVDLYVSGERSGGHQINLRTSVLINAHRNLSQNLTPGAAEAQ